MDEVQEIFRHLSDSLEGQNCLCDLKCTALDIVISLNLKSQNKLSDTNKLTQQLRAFNQAYQQTLRLEPNLRNILPKSLRQAALLITKTRIL